jgi:hypothetical protein
MKKIYYDDATLRSLKERGIHWYALAVSASAYQTWANRDFMTLKRKSFYLGAKARSVVTYDRILNNEYPL